MKLHSFLASSAIVLLGALASLPSTAADLPSPINPVPRAFNWWKARYEGQVKDLKERPCDVLFLGDSITDLWTTQGKGKAVWDKEWLPLNACNFGISGDQTSNLIWRIDDSGLPSITDPKVCVIMIGTNNTGHFKATEPAEKTAIGIMTVAQRLLLRYPNTHVLVLAIFPRGNGPQDPLRVHNDKINAILAATKLPRTTFLDINKHFLDEQGNLKPGLMYDKLHPSEQGFQVWADALKPAVQQILAQP